MRQRSGEAQARRGEEEMTRIKFLARPESEHRVDIVEEHNNKLRRRRRCEGDNCDGEGFSSN